MMSPDLQRIQHIEEYCIAIGKTIARYGDSFEIYAADADFQRSVSFSILQIGELSGGLSAEYRQATANRVQWGPMKAMRNLVADNYGRMEQTKIRETATEDIPPRLQFSEEQLSGQ